MGEQLRSRGLHQNLSALTNCGGRQAPTKLANMKQTILTAVLILAYALAVPAVTDRYTATAYCLKGRTASGEKVRQGIIAADPRVLPLGTLVTIAGLGDYVVKDTGRLIKGHIIDIWMPTCKAARTWGRRKVELTVRKK